MADTTIKVKCGFFDSVNKDRLYSAEEMNRPYKRVITNGVFATPRGTPSTDLQVLSNNNGRYITIKKGEGLFADKWFENPSDIVLEVPANTNIVPRRDSVIVQVNKLVGGRVGNIVYRTGTPNSNPLPPDINTVTNVIEYRIANIYVAVGASNINQDAIVDLRGSDECPWITSLIQQVDTSTLYAQWQNAYQNYYNSTTDDFDNWKETEQTAFEAFMDSLTTQLTVNTNIIKYESHYTSSANNETVIPINIASYNKSKDVLQVYVNRLRATPDIDYTISEDGTTITLTQGISANQNVNFLVLQSVVAADVETTLQKVQELSTAFTNLNSELAPLKADSGWINFELQNGASAYSVGLTPAYRKFGKEIYLRGCIKDATLNSVFATLPEGNRPAMTRYYTLATGNITATIEIGTNGQMKIANVIGSLATSSLIPIDTQFILE